MFEDKFYRVKNWREAFFDLFGYVESYAKDSQDAARILGYMKHLQSEVISFDEFSESED